MKQSRYLFLLAFLLCGCPARSLNPLFAEKDLVFNPSLVGQWADENGRESWTFQRSGEKGYRVFYREYESDSLKGAVKDSATYKAEAGPLGKFWFLDTSPARGSDDYHELPAHIFSKIWFHGDTLWIASFESDWLKKMIDRGKLKISHVKKESDIILTASTKELQQLVLRCADDDEAFPNPGALIRSK